MTMHMSVEGIDALLKKFEGCKLKAYRCPAGILTIGYGHTSAAGEPEVTPDATITKAQALEILHRDLRAFEAGVEKLVKVDLTQNQFDVLVDFAYNAGVGNLAKSGVLRAVNAGKPEQVPAELMKWNKGGGKVLAGLVRRRQAEGAWWTNDDRTLASPADEQEYRNTPDPVPVKTMADSKQGTSAVAVGLLGSVGAAKEIAAQVQDANDLFGTIMGLVSNPQFLMMAAVVGCGVAIWIWRKQHMEEFGV